MLRLIPIGQTIEENLAFSKHPECRDSIYVVIEYYKIIGFHPPWIGYYAELNNELVGSAGYKGQPVDNKIEIAYGTFPAFRMKGIGTAICAELVSLAIKTNPGLIITARTLPENNYSTRILIKNNFILSGSVWDKDDGNVWEWQYQKDKDKPSFNALS
jgi:RimJ/RimL family protein N-acetyltransferase